PRLTRLAAEQLRRLRVADDLLLDGVPAQLAACAVGDVAQVRDGRGPMADLDVRRWLLPRAHALDEVARVQVGPVVGGGLLALHPRLPGAAAPPAAAGLGEDFVADAVGEERAVGAVERLAV